MLKRKLSQIENAKPVGDFTSHPLSGFDSRSWGNVTYIDQPAYYSESHAARAEPFVLVLIDGDNTLFHEDYVRQGLQGGRRAAQEVAKEVDRFMQQRPALAQCKVVLRLYWNLRGLTAAYVRLGHGSHDTIRAFSRAFNKERPLFECIDAGDDKEAADSKIKANFDLYWHNTQCQHIILGVSGDRGYVGFLRQYVPATGRSSRLSLLEARPFHPDFAAVTSKFQAICWAIFRADSLQSTTANGSKPESRSSAPILPPARANHQRTLVRAASPAVHHQTQATNSAIPSSGLVRSGPTDVRLLHIRYNSLNQRVDEVLIVDDLDIEALRLRRLCNKFYLTKCQDLHCNKEHSDVLSALELEHLRAFAQMLPCRTVYCSDPTCVNGHQCSGRRCVLRKDCKFSGAMHKVDTSVVRMDTFTFDDLHFVSSRNYSTKSDCL